MALPRNLELRGDVYYVRVMVNGRRRRVSTGQTTLRMALKRADEIKVLLRNEDTFGKGFGKKKRRDVPFFTAYVQEYIEVYSTRKRGGDRNDRNSLRYPLIYFSRFRLSEITPTLATRYLNQRSEMVSNGSVNLERSILGAVFTKAQEDGLIDSNPWRKTKKLPTKPRMRILSLEDEDKLRAILEPKYQRWLTFMLGTGLRITEASVITKREVDGRNELIHVPEEGAKGGRARSVPLRPEVKAAIEEQLEDMGKLWHAPQATYQGMLRAKSREAGIHHLSPHDLRHTFATRYITGGGDIFTLSRILGHASVTLTEKTYVHLVPNDLVEKSRHVDLGLTA